MQFRNSDQSNSENDTGKFNASMNQAKINRTKFEENKAQFERNKAWFAANKAQVESNKRSLSFVKREVEKTRKSIKEKRRHYDRIKVAEFLTQFDTIDEKIDSIPMLCNIQEIAAVSQDYNFPADCEDNTVCRIDWDICNKDIIDAKRYLDILYEKRINFCE